MRQSSGGAFLKNWLGHPQCAIPHRIVAGKLELFVAAPRRSQPLDLSGVFRAPARTLGELEQPRWFQRLGKIGATVIRKPAEP